MEGEQRLRRREHKKVTHSETSSQRHIYGEEQNKKAKEHNMLQDRNWIYQANTQLILMNVSFSVAFRWKVLDMGCPEAHS